MLWVLDGPRLAAFGLDGTFQQSIRLPYIGTDLAIDGNGRFYVSHPIVHDQVRRAPDEFGTIVSTYEPDGTPAGPLVHITASDLTTPRFVLPGYTEVRVTASGDRVAVFYPASGSVDVFHSGELETSIQVCMPRALARAYEQQRADATSNTRSQTSVFLVTDVRLEPNGRILVVGPLSDPDNRYHIDAYDRSGRALGSTTFSAEYIRLPLETRFGGNLSPLVAFGLDGLIASFALSPRLQSQRR